MDRLSRIKNTLRHWNHAFCKSMTCKTNWKRDAMIISVAIILSVLAIGTDRYSYRKKIQAAQVAGVEIKKTSPEQKTPEQSPLPQENVEPKSPPKQEIPVQEKISTAAPSAPKETPKAKPAPAKKIVRETRSTGISCIKIPDHILVKLKNPPTPPDAKVKDGKRICHVLAEGEKDNPHKSSKSRKGGWAGCCYDPDEVPNPKCCYPVGSVYEKYLNKYFANPFPLKK